MYSNGFFIWRKVGILLGVLVFSVAMGGVGTFSSGTLIDFYEKVLQQVETVVLNDQSRYSEISQGPPAGSVSTHTASSTSAHVRGEDVSVDPAEQLPHTSATALRQITTTNPLTWNDLALGLIALRHLTVDQGGTTRTIIERSVGDTADNLTTSISEVSSTLTTYQTAQEAAITTETLTVTGDTTIDGTLTAGSLSVAGISSGGAITAPYFTATSTTATSTFAGGLTFSTLTGGFLKSDGSGIVSTSTINLVTDTSGTLSVASGGTGATTLTGLLLGNGTAAVTATTTLSSSYIQDAYVLNTGDSISGNLTFSGTAANIALGSNYLSGDGDDEGIFVDASGNVGIGTTTPSSRLTINGTNNISGGITLESSVPRLALYGEGSAASIIQTLQSTSVLAFKDYAGTTQVRIEPGGDVGINGRLAIGANYYTLNPPSNGLLVEGSVQIGTTTGGARLAVQTNHALTDALNLLDVDGIEIFTVLESGNVGIGDTTPASMLTIGASDAFQVTSAGRVLANAGASGAGNLAYSFVGDADTGIYRSAADEVRFQTGGTDRFTVTSAGNVGIGISSPPHKLSISGSTGTAATMSLVATDNFTTTSNRYTSFVLGHGGDTVHSQIALSSYGGGDDGNRLQINTDGSIGFSTRRRCDWPLESHL